MKTPNMMAWCDTLATTTDPQATGTMVDDRYDSNADRTILHFCCLGIGERMANPQSPHLRPNEWGQASREFIEWLGIYDKESDITFDPEGDGADPVLDWPREYQTSCAGLNDDWHLTFPQIADMIRYFGLLPMCAIHDGEES
jgi:hypothetical protein